MALLSAVGVVQQSEAETAGLHPCHHGCRDLGIVAIVNRQKDLTIGAIGDIESIPRSALEELGAVPGGRTPDTLDDPKGAHALRSAGTTA
jgi:hypothetical protein